MVYFKGICYQQDRRFFRHLYHNNLWISRGGDNCYSDREFHFLLEALHSVIHSVSEVVIVTKTINEGIGTMIKFKNQVRLPDGVAAADIGLLFYFHFLFGFLLSFMKQS